MPEQLKVGDVVMVTCRCEQCTKFGPPDPSLHNGPFIIREFNGRSVIAKAPFTGLTRVWNVTDKVQVEVVGRSHNWVETSK